MTDRSATPWSSAMPWIRAPFGAPRLLIGPASHHPYPQFPERHRHQAVTRSTSAHRARSRPARQRPGTAAPGHSNAWAQQCRPAGAGSRRRLPAIRARAGLPAAGTVIKALDLTNVIGWVIPCLCGTRKRNMMCVAPDLGSRTRDICGCVAGPVLFFVSATAGRCLAARYDRKAVTN